MASLLVCACAFFTPAAAFVPAGARLPVSQHRGHGHLRRSSCSAAARGRRSHSRAGGSAASSPLGMMFDSLAENMAGVANLFSGQKTITESRCVDIHSALSVHLRDTTTTVLLSVGIYSMCHANSSTIFQRTCEVSILDTHHANGCSVFGSSVWQREGEGEEMHAVIGHRVLLPEGLSCSTAVSAYGRTAAENHRRLLPYTLCTEYSMQ